MNPINSRERSRAFLNFLIFFIITIALIITAVLFSVQVPFKQNDQLTSKLDLIEKERSFSDSFENKMVETINLFDSINKKEVQSADIIDNNISSNISNLKEMISANNVSKKNLYLSIVNSFIELQIAKRQLRENTGKDADQSKLQDEVNKWRDQYDQAVKLYNQCRERLLLQSR